MNAIEHTIAKPLTHRNAQPIALQRVNKFYYQQWYIYMTKKYLIMGAISHFIII